MLSKEKLARINELAKKAKAKKLTADEAKEQTNLGQNIYRHFDRQ